MHKLVIGIAGVVLALGAPVVTAAPASAAETTRVVQYGPYTIPAAASETEPGQIINQLQFAVARPCVDCYITSFTPQLVDAVGRPVPIDHDVMLHHVMFASQWQRDATCGSSVLGLLGERFFASGNERTVAALPSGYGYRVRWYDSWNMVVDLMNHSTTSAYTVYVQISYTIRPSSEPVKPVKPVWLDIDQCGDSEYTIQPGFSDTHWKWSVNVPGDIVTMIGHVHGHGLRVNATKNSRKGPMICNSEATPSADPHRILSMSTCNGTPVLARVRAGESVWLHSEYQLPLTHPPADDVMGIMLAYINQT